MRHPRPLTVLLILLILAELSVIFSLSAEDGSTSGSLSLEVTRFIGRTFVPGFARRTAAEQIQWVNGAHPIVRKCAHFSEYTLLGVLVALTCAMTFSRSLWQALFPIAFCVLCAALDEWHQTFVAGRSGELRDVLIDSGGAMFGMLLCLCIRKLTRRKRICTRNTRA